MKRVQLLLQNRFKTGMIINKTNCKKTEKRGMEYEFPQSASKKDRCRCDRGNCSGNGCNDITPGDDDIDAESIKECK